MRTCDVFVSGVKAAVFAESVRLRKYVIQYLPDYHGPAISLKLPVNSKPYEFDNFPAFFFEEGP